MGRPISFCDYLDDHHNLLGHEESKNREGDVGSTAGDRIGKRRRHHAYDTNADPSVSPANIVSTCSDTIASLLLFLGLQNEVLLFAISE